MAQAPRRLVVAGLGNWTFPLTRHSIGQVLVEQLAIKAATQPRAAGSPTLLLNKQHPAFLSIITIQPPPSATASAQGVALPPLEIMFLKPRVLMNISGPAIASAIKSFLPTPLSSYRVITVQDDLDLSPLSYKLQRGGSPRGHNGVRSLAAKLNTRDFYRLRIGVGRPENKPDVAKWVMGALNRQELNSCECDENGNGGKILDSCWAEIMKIGWD